MFVKEKWRLFHLKIIERFICSDEKMISFVKTPTISPLPLISPTKLYTSQNNKSLVKRMNEIYSKAQDKGKNHLNNEINCDKKNKKSKKYTFQSKIFRKTIGKVCHFENILFNYYMKLSYFFLCSFLKRIIKINAYFRIITLNKKTFYYEILIYKFY